jgi:hypothetical protein
VFSDTEKRCGNFHDGRRGSLRGVALVALAAALLAAAPATAQTPIAGPTMFVHSAKSGHLKGGRLVLRAVGHHVTWASHGGRNGTLAVPRLHRRLFSPGTTAPTGVLHVAGHRDGAHPSFRLSRPRYNRARRTVSYRVQRVNHGRLPSRAARAAGTTSSFGTASLSIIGGQQETTATLQVSTTSYDCNDPYGRSCFGTMSGSGLVPGYTVEVRASWTGGSSSQSYRVDADGNLASTQLNLVCGLVTSFRVTRGTQDTGYSSDTYDAPWC